MVLPIGLVIELILLALLLSWWGRRRAAAISLVLAVAVLWVCSTPLVADALLGRLESRFPVVSVADTPNVRCLLVLGGSVQPALAPRDEIELGDSVDRVRVAARLFRAGKGQWIIVSGGNFGWPWSEVAEADLMVELLTEWGVPPASVILETGARNTRENAIYSGEILELLQCGPPLLITSAAHMPRSVAVFEKAGIEVQPMPVDVQVFERPQPGLRNFLPSADALQQTSDALRERLGLLVYRLRGWA